MALLVVMIGSACGGSPPTARPSEARCSTYYRPASGKLGPDAQTAIDERLERRCRAERAGAPSPDLGCILVYVMFNGDLETINAKGFKLAPPNGPVSSGCLTIPEIESLQQVDEVISIDTPPRVELKSAAAR